MSNHFQDTASSIFFIAEDITEAMKVTNAVGRSFAKLVNPTDTKNPSSLSGKTAKTQAKLTPGLSPVHPANSVKDMAILLLPLISKHFTVGKSASKKLRS